MAQLRLIKGGMTAEDIKRQERADQRAVRRQRKAALLAWQALPIAERKKILRKQGIKI